ncbi:TRAP transporter small permease [Roseovarius spongiae]|uniref:TRAP transporter small permease protein n=1 Tax=Roseovarius spongiae TaxID=2320272 RepID=A0A3A8AY26_9RHOB|nr:TRAP transporter small permease [Roseovarius spongiae]RKF16817.1 TRAP transporter small permease [Roseovarius spongiae]
MKRLLWLHDAVTGLGFWVATFGVLYLTLVTAGEVFSRYVLSAPTDWAPDTAAVAFALITFLAVPWLTWKAGHASMDFVVRSVRPRLSVWLKRLTYLIGCVVCALCAWIGGVETARQISNGVMIVSVTPIPKWAVFGPLVYAMGSSALYFARHLAASFASSDRNPATGGDAWSGT